MILKSITKAQVVLLIRPGATEFDDQLRIKGSLDMPLSQRGLEQVEMLVEELKGVKINALLSAPTESAFQTAELLAADRDLRVKVVDAFRNLDQGLWHGKLIEEVRRNHPKLYKQGVEAPEGVQPPEGESILQAKVRVARALKKCLKKHRDGVAAIVVPDPMATILESMIKDSEIHDLWASEIDGAGWTLIETDS